MGLFDEIIVNPKVIPDAEDWMTEEIQWQTKSLDSLLDKYKINEHGKFLKYDTKFEETPDDELPFPELPFIGAWREVDGIGKFNPYLYTGQLNFYTHSPKDSLTGRDVWYEYIAEFYAGTMIKIQKINGYE